MLRSMPSPSGRNTEKLYHVVRRPPSMAFDEMPSSMTDEAKLELLNFLRSLLSEEDHRAVAKMLGADPGAAMDEPDPLRGMPQNAIGKFGQDSMPGVLQRARANAVRIRVCA